MITNARTNRSRRQFLAGSMGTAGLGLATPALAQSAPEVKWRLQSSFPKSLEIIHGGAEFLARTVAALTDNRFQISLYPASQADETSATVDAVAAGRVEIGHTMMAYAAAKDPTFALATAMPFGLNARMQAAWSGEQGGLALLDGFLASRNLMALPGGNTGAAMGGWFQREIASPADLKGLKIRASGLTATVLGALGAEPIATPMAEIRSALDARKLDAAAWIGPFDDDGLGLYRSARHYYYPGWWAGSNALHFVVGKSAYEPLPKPYQAALAAAATLTDRHVLARYDALNTVALRRLAAGGAELKAFPEPVLDAAFKATTEALDAIAATNAPFKAILDSQRKARADGYLWHQIAEHAFDTYMMVQQRKRLL